MKKSILLLFMLSISLFTISCDSDDNDNDNTETIVPKTLLVQSNPEADSYVLQIKDTNDNVLETRTVYNEYQMVWNINTGSKFTLTINVSGQTFAGSYRLTEEYGNIILVQDSFTNHYNSFSVTKNY